MLVNGRERKIYLYLLNGCCFKNFKKWAKCKLPPKESFQYHPGLQSLNPNNRSMLITLSNNYSKDDLQSYAEGDDLQTIMELEVKHYNGYTSSPYKTKEGRRN